MHYKVQKVYNTEQDIVKCHIKVSFVAKKGLRSRSCHHLTKTPKLYLRFSLDWWK